MNPGIHLQATTVIALSLNNGNSNGGIDVIGRALIQEKTRES